MSECPTCGRKLRGDLCPYCDEEGLADTDVDSSPVTGESLVPVYACDGERQADHVVSLLESEGIPAFIASALDAGDASEAADLDGDIIIKVDEEDEERAREMIEAAEREMDIEE
jgi:hypothetical protein